MSRQRRLVRKLTCQNKEGVAQDRGALAPPVLDVLAYILTGGLTSRALAHRMQKPTKF